MKLLREETGQTLEAHMGMTRELVMFHVARVRIAKVVSIRKGRLKANIHCTQNGQKPVVDRLKSYGKRRTTSVLTVVNRISDQRSVQQLETNPAMDGPSHLVMNGTCVPSNG